MVLSLYLLHSILMRNVMITAVTLARWSMCLFILKCLVKTVGVAKSIIYTGVARPQNPPFNFKYERK